MEPRMEVNLSVNKRPLQLNQSLFIVPSHRNSYLKSFLSHFFQCLTIKDLHEGKSDFSSNYLVTGKVRKFVKVPNGGCFFEIADVREHFCPFVKLYLKDECAKHLTNPGRRCCLYVSCPSRCAILDGVTSICSTSNTICVFVSEVFYSKHKKLQAPVTYVRCIPLINTSSVHVSKCQEVALPHPSPSVISDDLCTETDHTCPNINVRTSITNSMRYVPLKELRKGTIVNVIGCVRHFKPSSTTKTGSSFYRTFTIVDRSLSCGKDIVVVAFAKRLNELPNIARIGDIILMQRIQVSTFRGSIQITCNSHSHFMLFDIKERKNQPYCKSQKATFFESDTELISSLQQWAISNGCLNSRKRLCKLSNIIAGLHFDLECMIMYVKQTDDCLLLTVYDCDETVTWNITIKDHINYSFIPGQAVYFHNVFANPVNYEIASNLVIIELLVKSYARRGICFSILHSIENRFMPSATAIESPMYITRISSNTCKKSLSTCTLADMSEITTVPKVFQVSVHITGIEVSSIEDCIKIKCTKCSRFRDISNKAVSVSSELGTECWNCQTISDPHYTYIIPLIVEDSTKRMMIYLWHEQAKQLLQNLQPTNAYIDQVFKINFLKGLEYLIGRNPFNEVPHNNHATCSSSQLECCICSYYSGPKLETGRNVSYFILQTELAN